MIHQQGRRVLSAAVMGIVTSVAGAAERVHPADAAVFDGFAALRRDAGADAWVTGVLK